MSSASPPLSAGCKDDSTTTAAVGRDHADRAGAAPAATRRTAAGGQHNRIPLGETDRRRPEAGRHDGRAGQARRRRARSTWSSPAASPRPSGSGSAPRTAKGSVKAKAEEETPDNWHTHAEVPDPLPPGSKFWVEVEPPTGETFKVSFDLKRQ